MIAVSLCPPRMGAMDEFTDICKKLAVDCKVGNHRTCPVIITYNEAMSLSSVVSAP